MAASKRGWANLWGLSGGRIEGKEEGEGRGRKRAPKPISSYCPAALLDGVSQGLRKRKGKKRENKKRGSKARRDLLSMHPQANSFILDVMGGCKGK